jgi:hypothetical protein
MNHKIVDESQDRKFFTITPNMIDDLGLSPYAVRLYLRLRRRAGENGACWENTRNLAIGCKMSTGQVTKAKKELSNANLILIAPRRAEHGHFQGQTITIVDLWQRNLERFSPVHGLNTSCSPEAFPSCSPGAIKEEPIIKNTKIEKTLDASSASPYPSKANNAFEGASNPLRNHPAIQAIKVVTDYFPPKKMYEKIIDLLGETPDIDRMQDTFDTWIANGYNPRNIKGWLFDWYPEKMHYVHPGRKFNDQDKGL